VVGDLVGHGSAQEHSVIGETPNLAARLQAGADPGTVVIAESTRRLLGGAFVMKPREPQALKGFDTPILSWAVLHEVENVSRFEASRPQGLTHFVGREHEVALLLDRWRDAARGEGQVVLISGEPGIGKSRILQALRGRIGGEPHMQVRYQCSPHHVNDAFYPMTNQIWHAAGFVRDEQATARFDKLEAMSARLGLVAKDIVPFVAALMSIPNEGRYGPLEMPPSEQKERTIAALIALFEGLTIDTPVLALLEDVHWIDPTSLDLFSRLVDRLPSLRALLVLTFRPEFVSPWVGRPHVSPLSLSRLGRPEALVIIDGVSGGKALPPEILEQIVAKTDGVPLFVEELTKAVLETGLMREENGAYILDNTLNLLAIPSTLHDSLMARLDRLTAVKEIAQFGAAIGREFSYRLLEAVSPVQGQALQSALGQLAAAELIHRSGTPPDATYVFKHALIQDAAYASLLRSRRQQIHADIARVLAERFSDQAESAPAVIAHHYAAAGLDEPAARYWSRAAQQALTRSAATEACRYIDAGLALTERLIDSLDRQTLELALQLSRANAIAQLRGFAAPETVAALSAAKRALDTGVGDDSQRFSVDYGLWAANYMAARMDPALALARQIVNVADRQDDTTYRLVGYRLLGTIQINVGQTREALESLRRAEQYRKPGRDKQLSHQFGYDHGLSVLSYKVLALTLLGALDQAAQTRARMRAGLTGHGHVPTIAACTHIGVVLPAFIRRDLEACEKHSTELVEYCAKEKVETFRLLAANTHACTRALRDPSRENLAAIQSAIETYEQSGSRLTNPLFYAHLAEALLAIGDAEGADVALRKAFDFIEESGEQWWLSELHRISGRTSLKRPESEPTRAETCFREALSVARSQESHLLELRAATDLARLSWDAGWPSDTRALLEPILAAIEGGEDMRDVRDARTLLEEIA
ncbi:MAG TPA: AAA family ATPase, partial [Xanthobacteraceae bacterium]|nr:AAA family ATPase [Xanthobacteraceae bacterium]